MFIKKNPNQTGEYGVTIYVISLVIYLIVFDYSDEYEGWYWFGLVTLFVLSFILDSIIIKISKRRYEELVNDVKEDVLKEVLEELDNKKKQ